MSRLRKFVALSPAARGVFLYSLLLLAVVVPGLRLCAVASWGRYLSGLRAVTGRIGSGLSHREIGRLVYAASSVVRARCLPRSLVLGHVLDSIGASVEMRLGVSMRTAGELDAHAWIELDGVPLGDGPGLLSRYATFPTCAAGLVPSNEGRSAR